MPTLSETLTFAMASEKSDNDSAASARIAMENAIDMAKKKPGHEDRAQS